MNKIIRFFRQKPRLSLLLIFGLWINSLPLTDVNIDTVREYNPLEIIILNKKTLEVSSKACLPGLLSAKREKFDLVLHARIMKTFPNWPARMDYQKNKKSFTNRQ